MEHIVIKYMVMCSFIWFEQTQTHHHLLVLGFAIKEEYNRNALVQYLFALEFVDMLSSTTVHQWRTCIWVEMQHYTRSNCQYRCFNIIHVQIANTDASTVYTFNIILWNPTLHLYLPIPTFSSAFFPSNIRTLNIEMFPQPRA